MKINLNSILIIAFAIKSPSLIFHHQVCHQVAMSNWNLNLILVYIYNSIYIIKRNLQQPIFCFVGLCLSLNSLATAQRPLDGLVFTMNTVKLYPSSSDTQTGYECNPRD